MLSGGFLLDFDGKGKKEEHPIRKYKTLRGQKKGFQRTE